MQPQPPYILLAASYNLTINAFDLSTGNFVKDFEISNSQANKIEALSDGKFYVASYSYFFSYDFNSSKSKKPTTAVVAHEGNVTDIMVLPNVILTCGDDKKVKLWDRRSNNCQTTIITKGQNNALVNFPATNQIIVGDENGCLSSYDLRAPSTDPLQSSKLDDLPVRALSQSPDNEHFIAALQNGFTKCFTTKTNDGSFSELYSINAHSDVQLNCKYSPNGKLFATCAANNSARIWDAATGGMKQSLIPSEMREWIWDVCFTPDSLSLCTGGTDGTCREYGVENGRILISLPTIDKCVSAIAVISG